MPSKVTARAEVEGVELGVAAGGAGCLCHGRTANTIANSKTITAITPIVTGHLGGESRTSGGSCGTLVEYALVGTAVRRLETTGSGRVDPTDVGGGTGSARANARARANS